MEIILKFLLFCYTHQKKKINKHFEVNFFHGLRALRFSRAAAAYFRALKFFLRAPVAKAPTAGAKGAFEALLNKKIHCSMNFRGCPLGLLFFQKSHSETSISLL